MRVYKFDLEVAVLSTQESVSTLCTNTCFIAVSGRIGYAFQMQMQKQGWLNIDSAPDRNGEPDTQRDIPLLSCFIRSAHMYNARTPQRDVSQNWWFGRVSDCLTNDIVPRSQRDAGILPQGQESPRNGLARTLASGGKQSGEEYLLSAMIKRSQYEFKDL